MVGGGLSLGDDEFHGLRTSARLITSQQLNDRLALFDFHGRARYIRPFLRPPLMAQVVAHVRLARFYVAGRLLSSLAARAAKLFLKPLAKLPVFRGDSLVVFRCISADVAPHRHRLPFPGLLSPVVGHAVLVGTFESVFQVFLAGSTIGILDSFEAQRLKHVAAGIARFMDFGHLLVRVLGASHGLSFFIF